MNGELNGTREAAREGAMGDEAVRVLIRVRRPRNFYRTPAKRANSIQCVCGAVKSLGLPFCTPCMADIDDQALRRSLYQAGHFAQKFWAVVEHLSKHGSPSRAPAYIQLIEAGKRQEGTKDNEPS